MLFSADVRGVDPSQIVAIEAEIAAQQPDRIASWEYGKRIVEGYLEHRATIDELIESTSRGWKLERMPAVDRAILRLAAWEMLYNPEVDAKVAISEAVKLAKEFSTDDSAGFVNGILSALQD